MTKFLLHFGCVAILLSLIGDVQLMKLKIETTKPVECTTKTKDGDTLRIHYKGFLEDGTEFDSSHRRGPPFTFKIGVGNVIKGWDQGLLDMCEGEQRRLTIPPQLAYGDRGFSGLIPAGATLIFETELIKINAHEEL